MRSVLVLVILAGASVALPPASADAEVCGDCVVVDPGCYVSGHATVCATFSPDCTSVYVRVNGQTFWVGAGTPGASQTVHGFDAGPVQVSSVTVTVDPVTVGPYPVSTPARTVSNVLCTSQLLAGSAA